MLGWLLATAHAGSGSTADTAAAHTGGAAHTGVVTGDTGARETAADTGLPGTADTGGTGAPTEPPPEHTGQGDVITAAALAGETGGVGCAHGPGDLAWWSVLVWAARRQR
jgi:hypothetical protein